MSAEATVAPHGLKKSCKPLQGAFLPERPWIALRTARVCPVPLTTIKCVESMLGLLNFEFILWLQSSKDAQLLPRACLVDSELTVHFLTAAQLTLILALKPPLFDQDCPVRRGKEHKE
eukprot:g32841.t1